MMKLSRRDVLYGAGAAVMLASLPAMRAQVLEGYLKPYGIAGSFIFSKTPLHCLECFKGDVGDLMVVQLPQLPAAHTGKVRLTGTATPNANKHAFFRHVMNDAKLVKNTFV